MASKRKRDALQEDGGSEDAPVADWPVGTGAPQAKLRFWEEHSNDKKLWDVTLRTADGTSVHANRLDLCDRSEYFQAQFLGSFKGSRASVHKLKDLQGHDLTNAIRSLYSNRIALSWANARRMLELASRLQLDELRAACCAYLQQEHLDTHTLEVFLVADQYTCDDLRRTASKALLRSPGDRLLPNIQLCTSTHLKELLSTKRLQARELEVHNAVCAWCKHHAKPQERLLALLRKTVRYEHLTTEGWTQLLASPEVQGDAGMLLHLAQQLATMADGGHAPYQVWPRDQSIAAGEAFTEEAPFEMPAGQCVISGDFQVEGLSQTWQLRIYPGGRNDDVDEYVAIYISCCDLL